MLQMTLTLSTSLHLVIMWLIFVKQLCYYFKWTSIDIIFKQKQTITSIIKNIKHANVKLYLPVNYNYNYFNKAQSNEKIFILCYFSSTLLAQRI